MCLREQHRKLVRRAGSYLAFQGFSLKGERKQGHLLSFLRILPFLHELVLRGKELF